MKKYLKLYLLMLIFLLFNPLIVKAADLGNTSDYGWAEKFGYIKMNGGTVDYGVTVTDASLSGYAWSEKTGWINFNDAGALYAVTNDSSGNLSGHAWSEKLGYISFEDSSVNNYYQATIDDSGNFSGYAWSEKGGYINMDDAGALYKVVTTWVPISAPTITLSAATSIEETTATLNGDITDTGNEDPTVTVYWGDNDGGQGAWDFSSEADSPAQPQGVAVFYENAASLSPGTLYYFSAKATNSGGTGWPAASLSFTTKPNPPTSLAKTAEEPTSISLSWTKGSGAEKTMIRYKTDQYPTGPADGTQAYFDTGTTATVSTLSANTKYWFRAWSYKTNAPNSGYSDNTSDLATYTDANIPSAPSLSTITVNSVNVDNQINSNPASTEFALYVEQGATCDGSGGWYFTANGSPSSVAIWQTDTLWGTITASELDEYTQYSFCSKAKNGDGDETNWSSTSTTTTTDAVPSISSATAQPNPQTVEGKTTFVVEWTAQSSSGETTNVHICKTNTLVSYACDTGQAWCENGSFTDSNPQTCEYTTASGDVASSPNTFYAFICDNENNCTTGTSGTFSVNNISIRLKGGIRLEGGVRLK